MTDYNDLIDAETWAFIRKTESFYPPDAIGLTIADQRRIYDQMCRQFHQGYPKGITAQDQRIAGVPCRVFNGASPVLVYLHGGGFVVGGLESHDDICAELCVKTGLCVVCIDYRLAPEHLHPAAFQDCLDVVQALGADQKVILVGDSAGGNLAAALSHRLKGKSAVIGQVLIYPGLGGDMDKGSYLGHANAPLLTRDDVVFYAEIRGRPAGQGHRDPSLTPLTADSFAGLPPTFAISAECDPIADDARLYVELIMAAGGRADWYLAKGLPHGFLRARTIVHRAEQAFDRVVNAVLTMAKPIESGAP